MIPEKNGLTRMVTSVQNERSRRQPHQTTFPLNSTLSILLSRTGVTHCCTIFLKFIPGIEILISISERMGLDWTDPKPNNGKDLCMEKLPSGHVREILLLWKGDCAGWRWRLGCSVGSSGFR